MGDRILEVNGVEVKKPEDLQEQLKNSAEGASLKIVPSGLVETVVPNGVTRQFFWWGYVFFPGKAGVLISTFASEPPFAHFTSSRVRPMHNVGRVELDIPLRLPGLPRALGVSGLYVCLISGSEN